MDHSIGYAMSKGQAQGFTLLEMLLALALGAMLTAFISSMVMPLLSGDNSSSHASSANKQRIQVQEFWANLERIADQGTAAFPTALDRGIARTSLAIRFQGTGQDMSADANGDGAPGIAHMDASALRTPNTPDKNDDDGDGLIDEDWQNGVDDDGDGLIDEDPGNNDDQLNTLGIPHFDDNADLKFDSSITAHSLAQEFNTWLSSLLLSREASMTSAAAPSHEFTAWPPSLPKSIASSDQISNSNVIKQGRSGYQEAEDDNGDGYSNNNPAVTWSARLENQSIICTTPTISYSDSTSTYGQLATLKYQEYECLSHVTEFNAVRTYNTAGLVLKVSLSYLSGENSQSETRTLVFP